MAQDVFKKGIIEMLALYLLQGQDLYAYEIIKQIKDLSGDIISIQGGSLYPILYKLTEKGMVSDRIEMIGKRQRMSRVYYHLEPAGEEYLRFLIEENTRIQQGIQNIFNVRRDTHDRN